MGEGWEKPGKCDSMLELLSHWEEGRECENLKNIMFEAGV